MVTEVELFEPPDVTALDFCMWRWMKSEVYWTVVDTRDELLACSLDATAHIKKREG
jgi:hypothetical protein